MAKYLITDTLLDNLADSISTKSGVPTPMTIAEMTDAVDDIPTGGGGASNVVTGTFTTTSTSGVQASVSIPYTGNGYPIMATVEVSVGASKWMSNSLPNRIVGRWIASKYDWETPMGYSYDYAIANAWATAYNGGLSGSNSSNQATFGASYVNQLNPCDVVAFKSATELIYYSSNDGTYYGLNPSTNYTYVIVYSS